MCLRSLALTVAVVSGALAGLEGGARPQQAFEVVSIRLINPQPDSFVVPDQVRVLGNRLQATNASAAALIRAAYGGEFKSRDQVIGGDAWVQSDRFDVDARATGILSETATSTLPPAAAQMLQQVLRERFQLRIRRETRRLPRYALTHVRADRALKPGIRVSDRDCTSKGFIDAGCEMRPLPGKFSMRGRPLQMFVEFLSRPAYVARPVVDDTRIAGNVDIDFDWQMDFTDVMASNASLLVAIQEQLGLKLEARDFPLPVLIIDAIERPSGN